jgi:hypothetical protein
MAVRPSSSSTARAICSNSSTGMEPASRSTQNG